MDQLPLVGRILGEFKVLERVGEGGFGEIFRARQVTLERDAVIKVIAPSNSAQDSARDRFTREAQLASRLDHPYAAHIYAFGLEPDGLQWIAMELVRGTSLADLLAAQGPLPVSRFVPLFEAICQVVQAAHEQGIVHRDIKPANVMVVARSGVLLPKLLDFGIARLYTPDDEQAAEAEQKLERLLVSAETIDSPGLAPARDDPPAAPPPPADATVELDQLDHEITQLFGKRYAQVVGTPRERTDLSGGAVYLGSPPYMAPELWLGPQAAGPACDIYALGVLAFECLTGSVPFTGDRPLVVARSHLVEPVPPVEPPVPSELDPVFAIAMAKRARGRYPDALAFARALAQACRATTRSAALPRPPAEQVAAVLARAPQPIAESLAAAEGSSRAEDARAGYIAVVKLVAHYTGMLALASWSRLSRTDAPGEIVGLVRRLGRGSLEPREWLDLATAATLPFVSIRDAFPLPELVDLCHRPDPGAGTAADRLRTVVERWGPDAGGELHELVDAVSATLRDAVELFEYELVARSDAGFEQWTGTRRRPRPRIEASIEAPEGAPILLDRNRAPVLSLWPLAKTIAPSSGADPELFFVAGTGRYGARLVSAPAGFERQDPELAGWLEELAGSVARDDGAVQAERSPYRGLAAFSVEDCEFFYGRERESEELANHLRVRSFAAVVGPSGAGKSSFVQAGVVPLLSADWRAIVFRPGPSPFAALREKLVVAGFDPPELRAACIARPSALIAWLGPEALRRSETIVLVLDQAEELVTLCRDEVERAAFAQALAAVRDESRVRVVLTLRDDFLMRLQRLPGLGERLSGGIHLLGTPSRGDLRRILTEPARRLGYEYDDPALVDEMVAAVVDNPSALALLSFTAARMWELRDRQFHRLGRRVYTSIGGVGGALAQHAEDVIQHMSGEERELVREAFRHLVTADGTRAVITKSELSELLGPQAARVIESLVQARLVVTSEASGGVVTVEITHEALLESWPRLVRWRREDAENARLRDQLRASAKQWDARGRERGLLWRGDVLVEYRLWQSRYRGRLTDVEDAFGAACVREHDRGVRRRRLITSTAFAVLAAAAVVLYVFAARARDSAAQATEKSITLLEEQGRRELLDHHPLRAATPLARAYALGGRQPALRFLLAQAMASVQSQGAVLRGHTGFVRRAMFSADGTRVITASDDKTVRLWDATTGAQLAAVTVQSTPRIVRSLDGAVIAGASTGEVTVWASTDLHQVAQWKLGPAVAPSAVAITADGGVVVVGDRSGGVHVLDREGAPRELAAVKGGAVTSVDVALGGRLWAAAGEDGVVRVWRAGDDAPTRLAHGSLPIDALGFDPAGQILAAGGRDGVVKVWEVATGAARVLAGHAKPIRSLAFAPDGSRLATASEDGTVRLWTLASELPPVVLSGHDGIVCSVSFDRSGHALVTAGADATVRLWDVTTGTPLAALDAHQAEVWFAAFDAAGARVVTAGFDHTARVWNTPAPARRVAVAVTEGGFTAAAFTSTGDRIVTAGADGAARIHALDGTPLVALPGTLGPLHAATLSPDGTTMVTGSETGAALWSVDRRAVVAELEAAKGGVLVARFRPDGREVATGGGDGVVRVFDPRTGAVIRRLEGHTAAVWGLAYSPDGARIATTSDDHTARVWDAATGRELRSVLHASEVNAVAFDPAGARLATASSDGTLRVIRVADGAVVGALAAHHDNIASAVFSADGARIVTASFDRSVVVWDAASLRELARLQRHAEAVLAIDVAPRTELLLSTGMDGAIWLTELPLERRTPREIETVLAAAMPAR
jgi:WD40 repeat protein/serine/threonine protein kinase